MGAAEMIAVDDNAFVMNNDRVVFEQRTIGKRESELDNFNMHNVGSGEAIGEGPISSGEKSPSNTQRQKLPPSTMSRYFYCATKITLRDSKTLKNISGKLLPRR